MIKMNLSKIAGFLGPIGIGVAGFILTMIAIKIQTTDSLEYELTEQIIIMGWGYIASHLIGICLWFMLKYSSHILKK